MSDPRQEDRLRPQRNVLPTQLEERVKLGLSPCDDDLPFAQAVRSKDEIQRTVDALRARRDA